MNIVNW